MALSASVCDSLRLLPARRNSREVCDRQRSVQPRGVSCSPSVCAAGPSAVVSFDCRGGCRKLVIGGRRRRSPLGQDRVLVRASDDTNNNSGNEATGTASSSDADVEALEARLGVGRRARKLQQAESGGGSPQSNAAAAPKPKQPAKPWEAMSYAEKAWALYIDPEKGVLFWLNKLAYGAIFAIIGGWIVFRFIGPALGWYELDQPLLSPDRLLDGGP